MNDIQLRDVVEDDLAIFFDHQRDPDATQMAAFPAREWDAFMAHWAKVLRNDSVAKQTILVDGQVAGNIVSFEQSGQREIGYWIGRHFWGQGVATIALSAFLMQVTERPLYAHVAKHNIASRRVLEKCGFRIIGEDRVSGGAHGEEVDEFIMQLGASESDISP